MSESGSWLRALETDDRDPRLQVKFDFGRVHMLDEYFITFLLSDE